MWWCWVPVAVAQDLELWDFDTSIPAYREGVLGRPVVGPPDEPWDGNALLVTIDSADELDGESYVQMSDPGDGTFIVTHDTLRFETRVFSALGWHQTVLAYIGSESADWRVGAGETLGNVGWTTLTIPDLSDLCGQSAGLDLNSLGYISLLEGYDFGEVDYDDFVMTGAVCPNFVDADGDGSCPQGVDLDEDGQCTGALEKLSFGDAADCDDTVFGPACLALSATPVAPGGVATFTVEGAEPGEPVLFLLSKSLGSTCPSTLGGACLGLRRGRSLGESVADSAGRATLEVVLSPSFSMPAAVWAQALVIRPGTVSDVSSVIQLVP